MIQIDMPKPQETSIGRRLFGMAAPIVGGALGGPAGAVAGGLVGSKLAGGSTQDAALSGIQSGLGYKGDSGSQGQADPGNPMSRRADAAAQDPAALANDSLGFLSKLPQDDPLRQEYAAPLMKMKMLSSGQMNG